MYHRLGPVQRGSIVPGQYVTQQCFEGHLRALKALKHHVIRLPDLQQNWPTQGKPVVITFDDGYASFYRLGLPALRRYGATATVFLVASQIGGRNEWDMVKGDVEEDLMTESMIQACRAAGIDFGSHSLTHPNLCQLDDSQLDLEIAGSKQTLEQQLNFPIDWFCYPYGSQDERVRDHVRAAGYTGACATGKGANTMGPDWFALKRINIRTNATLPYFVLKLIQSRRLAR